MPLFMTREGQGLLWTQARVVPVAPRRGLRRMMEPLRRWLLGDDRVTVRQQKGYLTHFEIRLNTPEAWQEQPDVAKLKACYDLVLRKAAEIGAESVELPVLPAAGAVSEEVLRAATDTVRAFLGAHGDMSVWLVLRQDVPLPVAGLDDLRRYVGANCREPDWPGSVLSISGRASAMPELPPPDQQSFSEEAARLQQFLPPMPACPAPAIPEEAPRARKHRRKRGKGGGQELRDQPGISFYGKSLRGEREQRRPPEDCVWPGDFRHVAIQPSVPHPDRLVPSGTGIESPYTALERRLGMLGEDFYEMLFRLIDERKMSDPECYIRANYDRRYFAKIRSRQIKPGKEAVTAFAIALKLGWKETCELVAKAGFSLTDANRFDVIIRYCIDTECYDVVKVNEYLLAFGQPLLGGKWRQDQDEAERRERFPAP